MNKSLKENNSRLKKLMKQFVQNEKSPRRLGFQLRNEDQHVSRGGPFKRHDSERLSQYLSDVESVLSISSASISRISLISQPITDIEGDGCFQELRGSVHELAMSKLQPSQDQFALGIENRARRDSQDSNQHLSNVEHTVSPSAAATPRGSIRPLHRIKLEEDGDLRAQDSTLNDSGMLPSDSCQTIDVDESQSLNSQQPGTIGTDSPVLPSLAVGPSADVLSSNLEPVLDVVYRILPEGYKGNHTFSALVLWPKLSSSVIKRLQETRRDVDAVCDYDVPQMAKTAFRVTLINGRLIAAEVIYQVRSNLDMMANIYLGDIQVLELAVTSLDYGAVKSLVLNGLADYIRGQSSMSSYTEEVLKDGKIREYLLSATTSEARYDYDRDPAALQLAQYHDHRHLLPILLIHGDSSGAEFWTGSGYTLLHVAARRGNINVIAWPIELGVDINAADQRGRQPLHEAIKDPKDGTVASIKLLLETGANIHAKHDISRAPIHCAAERANFRAMEMLIKTGVDVNAVNDHYMRQHQGIAGRKASNASSCCSTPVQTSM